VEGLPFAATEDDIKDFFRSVGIIEEIRLPQWHDSGRLRGYGHIVFKKESSAAAALELDGASFCIFGIYFHRHP